MPTPPDNGQRLSLASHVRACQVDNQVILLDLRHDKYLGLPQVSGLSAAIDGWPPDNRPDDHLSAALDLEPLVDRLAQRGLLGPPGNMATSCRCAVPAASLNALDTVGAVRPSPGRILQFLCCYAAAAWSLRHRSLLAISTSAAARRAASITPAEQAPGNRLRDLVAAYEYLRPLVFTTRDNCLFDSLALLRFLAMNGTHATWIIGVRARPFGAHSWLQVGDTVINDQRDHVLQFRPILVV